eukprot:7025346-Pyramimonas_sp.AAC.1
MRVAIKRRVHNIGEIVVQFAPPNLPDVPGSPRRDLSYRDIGELNSLYFVSLSHVLRHPHHDGSASTAE